MLFNAALEMVVRRADTDVTATPINTSSQLLAYADYIAILGRSSVRVQELFLNLEAVGKCLGVKINEDKAKRMFVSRSKPRRGVTSILALGTTDFEIVKTLTYLGSFVTNKNVMED